MPKNNTLTYRVGQLEKQVDKLDTSVDKLLTNELPHLYQEIISLKTRINVLTAVNIGSIILGLIASKLL